MGTTQRGFTLVEMAIVLVIIGLLLGGTLKGQELIASARAKRMAEDFRSIAVLVYGYQDKFGSFPGDTPQTRLDLAFGTGVASACSPAAAGQCAPGNGRIDGDWNATTAASETFLFWQHVRLANLATGPTSLPDAGYLPRNAEGGQLGVESGFDAAGAFKPFIVGLRGSYFICSEGMEGGQAARVDRTLDDGDPATGSVRGVSAGSTRGATAVAAYVEGQRYTVCAGY